MSRRLRIEDELAAKIEEPDVIIDYLALKLAKIHEPLIWTKTKTGIRIQDLKEEQFDEVIEMLKNHYIPYDVLCTNSELMSDEVSLNCFLYRLQYELKDCCSIVAIDENYENDACQSEQEKNVGKIVGALILRIIRKVDSTRVFSSIQLTQGEAMKKCMEIKSHLNMSSNLFRIMDCECYLRYYELCVLPDYKNKHIDHHLMLSGLLVAHSFHIPVVAGIFPNYSTQKLARDIGMEIIKEVGYCSWRDEDNELIFDDPGPQNYTCALMAGTVPPPASPTPQPSDTNLNKPKITRFQKQVLLQKRVQKDRKTKSLTKADRNVVKSNELL